MISHRICSTNVPILALALHLPYTTSVRSPAFPHITSHHITRKTSMERVSVMASLRDGRNGALPLALRSLGAWMRQLVFRMVAWDADARQGPAGTIRDRAWFGRSKMGKSHGLSESITVHHQFTIFSHYFSFENGNKSGSIPFSPRSSPYVFPDNESSNRTWSTLRPSAQEVLDELDADQWAAGGFT